MLEYPSFCYLQNHKTGCTFVEECLRQFCCEPLLAYKKHAALSRPPGKLCFTNVREPLATYQSLYFYGLEGKGTVYFRLVKKGYGCLYADGPEGFSRWLDFVTQEQHSELLSDTYPNSVASLLGFMTWRFLRLACPGFEQNAPRFQDTASLMDYVTTNNVITVILRQESLRDDLKKLIQGKLAPCFQDRPAVLQWIDNSPKINTTSKDLSAGTIPTALLARIKRQEIFLYKNFYPDVVHS